MRQLTVDVNVLINGSVSGSPHHEQCNSLMRCLEQTDLCGIVLDNDDRIITQYKRHLAGRPYGMKWLRTVLDGGRVAHVPRANIPNAIRVKFEQRGFVGEDYKNYVRTCASSCCKVLTTHDPDFSRASRLLRKELDIRVEPSQGGERFARVGVCGVCDVTPPSPPPK